MERNKNLYCCESDKSVTRFIEDFTEVVHKNQFVINNAASMDMKETLRAHGGQVPDEFDLHMVQVCKPAKADKSLSSNPERAILMPKFVHVFSRDSKTQIRYMRYLPEHIRAMVPDDPPFPESLTQTFNKICAMIDEAR